MLRLITILFIITMAHGTAHDINNITSMASQYTIQNCTDVGYISSQCSYHGITHNSDIACNYEQNSKYIALLLSLFLGIYCINLGMSISGAKLASMVTQLCSKYSNENFEDI